MAKQRKINDYRAKDIYVLKGLEPIRKRPAMYIGSTGPSGLHHLIQECVSNSIDEAIMGFCNEISVSLLPHNRVEIKDNGRGIPVDIHPETKRPALETVMTYLHAGAKFGSKIYASVGGLHGIGVSAVCALSVYLRADVFRDGYHYYQEYSRGKATTKLKKLEKTKKTGTIIVFEPDPLIFREIKWSVPKILNYLRKQAFLTKGIKITFWDKKKKGTLPYVFYFQGGLLSYIRYLTQGRPPRHPNIFYVFEQKQEVVVEAALRYTKEYESFEESFANNVFTPEGGTHLTGFRIALTKTLNDYALKEKIIKNEKERLSGQDAREGLTAIISVKVKEPQFEGQTKKKLGNQEVRSIVAEVISEHFFSFLEQNSKDARAILEGCILAKKARTAARRAKETVFKKGLLRSLSLPGKLADCSSSDPRKNELFIVEGESAGGSAKQARDRRFQAVLPLRGKILNVEKARLDKVLTSKEIKSLIVALGTGIGEEFDISKLRYHKIILMQDADIDGMHIRTLLLTLFYRYFRPLIDAGYLYIAQPPLYQIRAGKEIRYCYSEEEKENIIKQFSQKGIKNLFIQRYKGLGEMNPEQLWETTMNPEKRVLLRVKIEDGERADKIFDTLMGEQVEPRKRFIQLHAQKVKNLDI